MDLDRNAARAMRGWMKATEDRIVALEKWRSEIEERVEELERRPRGPGRPKTKAPEAKP